jgi:hypothetical protein
VNGTPGVELGAKVCFQSVQGILEYMRDTFRIKQAPCYWNEISNEQAHPNLAIV